MKEIDVPVSLKDIEQKSERFVKDKLNSKLSPKNFYHDVAHTERVVEAVKKIAENENCGEYETSLLTIAAWFHDLGFTKVNEGHEKVGATIAREFLQEHDVLPEHIEIIEQLIISTTMSKPPENHLQMIMKDADCCHVASENYFDLSDTLREEMAVKKETLISKVDWYQRNLEFFDKHTFYTESAKKEFQPLKDINYYELEKKLKKRKNKNLKNKRKRQKLGRGVETMFRVTLKNHIDLSAIADTKANILLSVNAIIISVAISSLLPKIGNLDNSYLVTPTFILVFFSVASIVMSILSTRPNISNVTVTREMIKNKQTNILFFGNFFKMSREDFEWGMEHLIENQDALYDALTKDLYYLGLVLERKYRLLRITYTVFMVGIVVSVLSFMVSFYLKGNLA